ncbi:MAG: PD-(D/E)XK nuclease family protein, partial [Planctomycetota bacterium]
AVLNEIYGGCNWNLENPRDRITFGAAKAINQVLLEQSRLPSDIATSLDAAQAIELVLEQVADRSIPEVSDSNSVELIGWLDAFLEDSSVLILTGMNEGVVPLSESSETFLPNALRELLDLNDNRRRYARDAYALKSMVTLRPNMPIVTGRRDIEGNPRVPSRLLFAADKETISQRWLYFFQATASPNEFIEDLPNDSIEKDREFQFNVPRPAKLPSPIEKMRPTDFKLYLECPYRFYLKRVLQYRCIGDDETEMTGGVFGDVAHEVLNRFGTGPLKDSTDASAIYADLAKKLTAHCRKQFGPSPSPSVRIQIEQLKIRFYEFAFHQARWAKDYEIAYVEEPTDKFATIEAPSGIMKISGRIDRIDRHRETGEYVILDYKTSDGGKRAREAHQGKDEKAWKDLQLPIYRRLAEVMDIHPISNIGYIILSKKLEDIRFDLANWTEAELASADEAATKVVEDVLAEVFWPPGKVEWANYDDYRHVLMEGILERAQLVM